ncbi:16S rRNA (guanine(1207)-N(2))-methyltransferase RsmC [Buchnera aphidicola (Mindarus keteleerifoliae)]|uniref:16S rRNA (guanine(1207)-N(2))-methyltransferase RsmC n=1 Tax=Buchnera aphidicola TaxID=9 RepID=UPI0031B66F18
MNKKQINNISTLLIKNQNIFLNKKVFFSGLNYDVIIKELNLKFFKIHTNQYNVWKKLKNKKNIYIQHVLLPNSNTIADSNTLMFFWKKNVLENIFQLTNLFSLFPIGSDIYIIGENKSGIKSSPAKLKKWIFLKKISFLRKCSLLHGKITKKIFFSKKKFVKLLFWKDLYLCFFPGVFSYNKIDEGSKLLLSTFLQKVKGDILDIGCGCGILSAFLLKNNNNKINAILSDVHLAAHESSKLTLKKNKLKGKFILSDVYSEINGKFDLIISNIPLHEELNINLKIGISIIKNSIDHLKNNGEIRIVFSSFINILEIFKKFFKSYKILKRTKKFIVLQGYKKNAYTNFTRSGT